MIIQYLHWEKFKNWETKEDVMKLKQGFIMREIAGEIIVVPSGDELNLNMMITLNDTGRFLWKHLEIGINMNDLVQAMLEEYDVDEQTARTGAERFVEKLRERNFLETEQR